jgi:hypothetical protein
MSDKSNPRALWMACGRGDLEVAAAQLASGDKIDAREPNVCRPLMKCTVLRDVVCPSPD